MGTFHIEKRQRLFFIFLVTLGLAACDTPQGNAPQSLQQELFGFHDTACAPVVPMSKMNHLQGFTNQLTLTEDLYTDNAQCDGRRNSPMTVTTSVTFTELASPDVSKPYIEISISDYSVKLFAGSFTAAFQDSSFCGYEDWQDPFAPIVRDITTCMQQENPRDEMRWILERSNGQTRLGFLSRHKAFDPTQVDWLEPGDFKKTPNTRGK